MKNIGYLRNKNNERVYPITKWEAIEDNNNVFSTELNSPDGSNWTITIDNHGNIKTVKKVADAIQFVNQYNQLTQEFDEFWGYSGNDLGYSYTPQATTIKLWAPTAKSVDLLIYDSPNSDTVSRIYRMSRGTSFSRNDHSANTIGVWSVKSDLR